MAARLAPVTDSAIGADTKNHSEKILRNATGVRPDKCAMSDFARAAHLSVSSSTRIADRIALFIPSNQRAKRSVGTPEARSPPSMVAARDARSFLMS